MDYLYIHIYKDRTEYNWSALSFSERIRLCICILLGVKFVFGGEAKIDVD